MSDQLGFQGSEVADSPYSLGSRRLAFVRLALLFTSSLVFVALHYLYLWKLTNWPLAAVLLIGTWVAVFLRLHSYVSGWIDFFLKDSAYGVITEDGIKYRTVLGSRFLPWPLVERIEYSPRNGDRIDVFKVGAFTFTQVRPIHFGPAPSNGKAIQGIEKLLNRQGTPEKLVTTNSRPEKFFHL
jgi:Bacterial PH domain